MPDSVEDCDEHDTMIVIASFLWFGFSFYPMAFMLLYIAFSFIHPSEYEYSSQEKETKTEVLLFCTNSSE
ncbi:hypothetical protein RchiOBHm_Chr2g0170961 [Rosa chinensis]|uniref:Transmembrane protein n=1 Tax=Rosa chinensis TaxID=74649 RepID=A0A2P6S594_ROSCH|nr:hypothetical protein RchiOBHm_Chr2g0170961 [Rosa chinensis]